MKLIGRIALIAMTLSLAACGGSHRPVYSGHEASTEGVPGFVDGKKTSPYVKLGQSYTVDGEEYVPHYQPDYVEEGLASWYGPGFHGGKTANGESYDKHDFTAAHRTLPLPSIVKVTMLDNGKTTYVRINDRGPYAKGRIIDLSYAAAKEIGLAAKGVARVRLEYMPRESQRFADLLAQGREPQSIDLASEVIDYSQHNQVAAAAIPTVAPTQPVAPSTLSPISTAYAQEGGATAQADISSSDLAPPSGAVAQVSKPAAKPIEKSPFSAMNGPAELPAEKVVPPVRAAVTAQVSKPVSAAPVAAANSKSEVIQLGAFLQQANAQRLHKQVARIGESSVTPHTTSQGTFYIVRMGPYSDVKESARVLDQLHKLGLNPKIVKE